MLALFIATSFSSTQCTIEKPHITSSPRIIMCFMDPVTNPRAKPGMSFQIKSFIALLTRPKQPSQPAGWSSSPPHMSSIQFLKLLPKLDEYYINSQSQLHSTQDHDAIAEFLTRGSLELSLSPSRRPVA
jgi:hypothetical protein